MEAKPRDCVKGTICQLCQNRSTKKGLFGEKITCNLKQKPISSKCFYFSCEGSPGCSCSMCSHLRRAEKTENN